MTSVVEKAISVHGKRPLKIKDRRILQMENGSYNIRSSKLLTPTFFGVIKPSPNATPIILPYMALRWITLSKKAGVEI
jgi:hypothetical protein